MTDIVTEELGKLVVRLQGEVDLDCSPVVRKLLLECVGWERDVIVDLSAVDYIDSSGIASLVVALQAANRAGAAGGRTDRPPIRDDANRGGEKCGLTSGAMRPRLR